MPKHLGVLLQWTATGRSCRQPGRWASANAFADPSRRATAADLCRAPGTCVRGLGPISGFSHAVHRSSNQTATGRAAGPLVDTGTGRSTPGCRSHRDVLHGPPTAWPRRFARHPLAGTVPPVETSRRRLGTGACLVPKNKRSGFVWGRVEKTRGGVHTFQRHIRGPPVSAITWGLFSDYPVVVRDGLVLRGSRQTRQCRGGSTTEPWSVGAPCVEATVVNRLCPVRGFCVATQHQPAGRDGAYRDGTKWSTCRWWEEPPPSHD